MEENGFVDSVRTRLILAGMRELEEHGTTDFSLRRVAQRAQVSCAAPYRHFQDRQALIREVFGYIREKWQMLFLQVCTAVGDPARVVREASLAYIRFWMSNPSFRSLLFSSRAGEMAGADPMGFDRDIGTRIGQCLPDACADRVRACTLAVLTQVYGTLTVLMHGEPQGDDEILAAAAVRIDRELKQEEKIC